MSLEGFFLLAHIFAGSLCLIVGLIAALSKKEQARHTLFGEWYHGSYVIVFVSAVALDVMNWEESAFLFYIALFSYGLALLGYLMRKKQPQEWLPWHIGGMLGSYIGIVTAVLVVNAEDMLIVHHLPSLIIWLMPTVIGTPIIIAVTNRVMKKN